MTDPLHEWTYGRKLLLGATACFALLGIALAIPLMADRGTPTLRVSAGPEGTRRYRMAEYLREKAVDNKLEIRLSSNAGSEECLDLLKRGKLDAAIVSNGVVVPDDDDIHVLGAVQVEAVHILLRKQLVEEGKPLAQAIRGKRVNVGEKGSTEYILARECLAFARLKLPTGTLPGDVIPTEYSKAYLVNKTREIMRAEGTAKEALIEELPDCLVVLASMPSTIVQQLVEAADYRVVAMPGARAFLMDKIVDDKSRSTILDREYLERTQIPMNSYFSGVGQPAADCETIGIRLVVVARKDAPANAIRPLMKTLFEGEFARRIQTKSPREVPTPYAMHAGAESYLDRDKPLPIRETIEQVTKGFSVFGAFSAGALTLYGFLRKKKVRKPSDYFAAIRQVDMIARGAQTDEAAPIQPREFIQYLDDRLLRLRQDLIEDICDGKVKGDQVIANILSLLKDTRANLQRIGEEKMDALAGPAKPTLRIDRRAS